MGFNIGETVGDCQVIGVLGAGGMGKVYKVRNIISDRIEAMKVLLPDLANEPELADRFIREIKLLATLSHPNIAALHTAMRIENQLIMLMEFVEGRTLEDRLKEGPIGVSEATSYTCQALSALGFAHERGVVHRDIKPANMMVTASGELKLMDFGIAKAVADHRLTITGTTLGSLFYMSPEQVKGSASIDGRSDLYSVGVTLYEIVTGTRPFKGESDYSIMVAHLEQQPRPPIDLDPTLPVALNEIILTAIQKDAGERFQTANAFRSALESVQQSVGGGVFAPTMTMRSVAAAPPPPPPPAPPFAQEAYAAPPPPMPFPPAPPASGGHRGLWLALGGLLLVVAAIQLPKRFGANAGGSGQAAAPASETTPPVVADTPATPVAETAPIAAEPVAQPAVQPAVEPAVATPAAPRTLPAPATIRDPGAGRSRPAGGQASGTTPPETQADAPASQPQPGAASEPASNANAAALDEESDRLGKLGVEANTIRGSLQNLENQQRSTGVGLRGDISASWKRMEYLLDQSEAALKRQDAAAAKKNLDAAEREIERLDKFLGR